MLPVLQRICFDVLSWASWSWTLQLEPRDMLCNVRDDPGGRTPKAGGDVPGRTVPRAAGERPTCPQQRVDSNGPAHRKQVVH